MSGTESDEFFGTMATRLRNETHLSDLTFTAMDILPFKKDFVQFFFNELPLDPDEEITVSREFTLSSGDGQPDLVFRGHSWDLVVENKLGDQKYHFDQYGKTPLSKSRSLPRIGLIANHTVLGDSRMSPCHCGLPFLAKAK